MVSRLLQVLVVLGITGFWLHSMRAALELDKEAVPLDVRVGRQSYEVMLARALAKDPKQFVGIYQNGRRIGHSYTEIERLSWNTFLIENHTNVDLDVLLMDLPTRMHSQIQIGREYMVDHFTVQVQMKMAGMWARMQIEGEATDDGVVVTVPSLTGGAPRTVKVAREATLFNGLSPFVGVPNLKVGETWSITGIDVMALAAASGGGEVRAQDVKLKALTAVVERTERFVWEGADDGQPQELEVFVASLVPDPRDDFKRRATAWIAPDGRILKEEHGILDWTFTFLREPLPDSPGWRRTR